MSHKVIILEIEVGIKKVEFKNKGMTNTMQKFKRVHKMVEFTSFSTVGIISIQDLENEW